MEKMKKLICLLMAVTIILGVTSCSSSDSVINGSSSNTSATEKETAPEPELPDPPTSDELYNILTSNKSVWERENMISGTLIDLDSDNMPEFLLMCTAFSPSLTIFKYDGEALKEIKNIEHIYVEGVFSEFKAILPYTDETGVRKWVLPYIIYPDDSSYSDYSLSIFDFTDENISETVKFSSRIYFNNDDLPNKYYGYPYLNTEFYIDGVLYTASQDKIDEFQSELDRMIQEFEESEDEVPNFLWSCGGYYPNPSQAEWEDLKMDFLNELLAVEPAYNLFPNIDSEYIWYGIENSWHNEENIDASLKKLSEAYCNGDDTYLRTNELFYDHGGAMCKPVIYLYPSEPTDITVHLELSEQGYLTCTYPEYGSGWNVTAYPDGTVINKADGLEYSYLYWEGDGKSNWDFSSGFVVKGSDTAMFLREKLAYLGLTPREYNEFIVYWLPLMQNNKYNLITFQTTAYEESAKLEISPEPDSILRVFMAYTPLQNTIDIPEQELKQFERTGFSVIEWGGTCVE